MHGHHLARSQTILLRVPVAPVIHNLTCLSTKNHPENSTNLVNSHPGGESIRCKLSTTLGADIITIRGQHFWIIRDGAALPLVTISGRRCRLVEGKTTETSIECITSPSVGGKKVPMQISIGDRLGVSDPNDSDSDLTHVSYPRPRILGLCGCNNPCEEYLESRDRSIKLSEDGGGQFSIEGCDHNGGQVLTLFGTNFGAEGAKVLVGARVCSDARHNADSPHTHIECNLPANQRGLTTPVVAMQAADGQVVSFAATHVFCTLLPTVSTEERFQLTFAFALRTATL